MLHRSLSRLLRTALADTPVIFIHGARQTGKTTLAKNLVKEGYPATYLTLDTPQVLTAATSDPEGFIAGLARPVILDEVQLAPELFRVIKAAVDRDRRPGQFLLTGSAHLLVLPRLAEALVGRMEILTLWPLSQGEIVGREEHAIDILFADQILPSGELDSDDCGRDRLVERLVRGGYPELLTRKSEARRRAWFDSYVLTILQRDVRELANIDGLLALPNLLRLVAARSGTLLNTSELSRSSGIPRATLKRYLALLEGTFLVLPVPAWASNLSKRLVRSPKMVLLDTGLLSFLQGMGTTNLLQDPTRLGPVLENFVILELIKQIGWSTIRPRFFHFRTHAGQEVDLVLENAAGEMVGVEVKARSKVTARDFRSLHTLQEALGDRFRRGVVFYTGRTAVPFGERLHALPVSWLWLHSPPRPVGSQVSSMTL